MNADEPSRGDIWLTDFDPTRGHEQAGRRPSLVVSVNSFNRGPLQLVVVVPLTTRDRRNPFAVPIPPPEGGVRQLSFIKCEVVRSLARERLIIRWGSVRPETLGDVEVRLRAFLGL